MSVPAVERQESTPSSTTPTTSRPKKLSPVENTRENNQCIDDSPRSKWEAFLTPRRLRHDPSHPFVFSTSFMLLCAFAGAVSSANLYYTYPILNKAADEFNVTYQTASLIPQLLQAGYGVGILLLCPLGDMFRLRPIILTLVLITTITWLMLCLTRSFQLFSALGFIAGFANISPQLLVPLIGALAPPDRKATAVSIVLAGMMLGLAVPRVVAGIITQYTSWRNIYWTSLGLQAILLASLWFFFPDFPAPNTKPCLHKTETSRLMTTTTTTTYLRLFLGILKMLVTTPNVFHACVITFLTNAILGSFWTTLTAHLSSPPANFSPLQIGVFSTLAIATTMIIPGYSYFVIERFVTHVSCTAGLFLGIILIAIDTCVVPSLGVAAGAGLQGVGVDFGIQIVSVAYRAELYKSKSLQEKTHLNKSNVAFTAMAFLGQLFGTSVGNAIYAVAVSTGGKGWMSVGIRHLAVSVVVLVLVWSRGPREAGWFGWRGGRAFRMERGGKLKGEA